MLTYKIISDLSKTRISDFQAEGRVVVVDLNKGRILMFKGISKVQLLLPLNFKGISKILKI